MKTKIAIAGLPKSNKTLLGTALSIVTGIPLIQNRTIYEWYKIYNLPGLFSIDWKDMVLIAASSFFERVKVENCFDQFISDGTIFSELMFLKSNYSNREQKAQNIYSRMESVTGNYAVRQYDLVVHAQSSLNKGLSDDAYAELYQKYNIPYKTYNTEILENTLKEIVSDLNLSVTPLDIDCSINQARINLFQNI